MLFITIQLTLSQFQICQYVVHNYTNLKSNLLSLLRQALVLVGLYFRLCNAGMAKAPDAFVVVREPQSLAKTIRRRQPLSSKTPLSDYHQICFTEESLIKASVLRRCSFATESQGGLDFNCACSVG